MNTHSSPGGWHFAFCSKRRRWLALGLCLWVVALALCACSGGKSEEEKVADTPLMRLLRFVPDTPEYREYVTFGDAAAWHTSWNVPRIENRDQLDFMDRDRRAYWMGILPRQTTPPQSLGMEYMLFENVQDFYGFDIFNLDRYLGAGNPPDWITVVEFGHDGEQIAQALNATGYAAQELENGGTLYSIRGDYELDIESESKVGRLGNYNRILLLDGQLIIAKATTVIDKAMLAYSEPDASLAEDPNYIAAAAALEDPALDDTGELMGVILSDDAALATVSGLSAMDVPEEVMAQIETYAEGPQLPLYSLVAFATRHTKGATSLILAVVFPEGTDADTAADTLAERMKNYVSLRTRGPLDERWHFDRAMGVKAAGLPVALVVMQAPDPPPTPADAAMTIAGVHSWADMFWARDVLFLLVQPPGE